MRYLNEVASISDHGRLVLGLNTRVGATNTTNFYSRILDCKKKMWLQISKRVAYGSHI